MKIRPALAATLVLAAVVGAGAACGGDGGGGSERLDLTIGDIVPLSGVLADFGPPARKSADLALREIRRGIAETGVGHTVEVRHLDEQTKAPAAVAAARRIVEDGAACIAGAWVAANTISVSQAVTTPEKVLQISPASTSSQITTLDDDGYLNRTAPPDSLQGSALADAMAAELKGAEGKTVNVGARDDAYGRSLAGFFRDAWVGRGGQIGEQVIYEPDLPSYRSEAQAIASGEPDAWVIIDFPETYQRLAPALVGTGTWEPARTFTTDGLASNMLPEDVGAEATEGLRATAPGTPRTGEPQVRAFDELFRAAAPTDVPRQTFDAQNFDAVVLCYLAAVAAGRASGEAMKDVLEGVAGPPGRKYTWQQLPAAIAGLEDGEDVDYEGASGSVDLDGNGDPTWGVYDLLEFRDRELRRVRQIPVTQDE